MNNKKQKFQESQESTEDSLFEEFDNLNSDQIKAGQSAYKKAREKASQITQKNLNRLKDPENLEDLD